jgi:hypothetical protein
MHTGKDTRLTRDTPDLNSRDILPVCRQLELQMAE